jgi:hypothetical protein
MKKLLTTAVLAITLTTGFTCSKNTPHSEEAPTATQKASNEVAPPEAAEATSMNQEEAAPAATE